MRRSIFSSVGKLPRILPFIPSLLVVVTARSHLSIPPVSQSQIGILSGAAFPLGCTEILFSLEEINGLVVEMEVFPRGWARDEGDVRQGASGRVRLVYLVDSVYFVRLVRGTRPTKQGSSGFCVGTPKIECLNGLRALEPIKQDVERPLILLPDGPELCWRGNQAIQHD